MQAALALDLVEHLAGLYRAAAGRVDLEDHGLGALVIERAPDGLLQRGGVCLSAVGDLAPHLDDGRDLLGFICLVELQVLDQYRTCYQQQAGTLERILEQLEPTGSAPLFDEVADEFGKQRVVVFGHWNLVAGIRPPVSRDLRRESHEFAP